MACDFNSSFSTFANTTLAYSKAALLTLLCLSAIACLSCSTGLYKKYNSMLSLVSLMFVLFSIFSWGVKYWYWATSHDTQQTLGTVF